MRESLERLAWELERVEPQDFVNSISDLKRIIGHMLAMLDRALPLEVEPD